ncbi:MAG: response regulator [Deltaproteobacteria bacterium]|nr:response regulator [Deltaproteobacteria bacterium]
MSEMRPYRVLIVDDHADMRQLIAFTLKRSELPLVVTMATNGIEALVRAQADCPNIVLLDVMMPGMNGFEVCAQLRSNPRTASACIIMLTALTDADAREEGRRVGADSFMTKPFRWTDLVARIREAIEQSAGEIVLPDEPAEVELVAAR